MIFIKWLRGSSVAKASLSAARQMALFFVGALSKTLSLPRLRLRRTEDAGGDCRTAELKAHSYRPVCGRDARDVGEGRSIIVASINSSAAMGNAVSTEQSGL